MTAVDGLVPGASVAVNGCCLTAVARGDGWWEADVVDETLDRSTLGTLTVGDTVNLERPVELGGRLDGHLVTGHVDAAGRVVRPVPDLEVEIPARYGRYVVEKGSIAIDGVSLTVVGVSDRTVRVAVIPHTAEVTTLGRLRPGDAVNLEFDLLAKYVERLLGPQGR